MSGSFWIFLGIIIVTSIVADAVVKIIKASKGSTGTKQTKSRFEDMEADIAALEQDLEDARERIIVLEKIVTDDKYNLGKQIDDLASNQD